MHALTGPAAAAELAGAAALDAGAAAELAGAGALVAATGALLLGVLAVFLLLEQPARKIATVPVAAMI
ncbi:MAG TPA: hypothetical protein VN683_10300 [Acidothermaceae bacterium]|nr:hypothetical protein [Acidothermaceae bacterium]